MRKWSSERKSFHRFEVGVEVVSFIYPSAEGAFLREDKPADGLKLPQDLPAGTLGWWRWTAKNRPPTQRELNERLEQLWNTLEASQAPHKEALTWLVGLYLTRKKILRQESGGFVHAKTGQKTSVNQDSIDPSQMESAMTELMQVIA